jgi:hypothetical protein
MMSDNMKIGVLLTGLGFLFLFLGMILFFDSGLLAIGNILFLAGFPFIIGFSRSLQFFNPMRPRARVRGIVCFFLGVSLVLLRWGLIGMLVELVGMVEMFGTFLPMVIATLRSVPYLGTVLSLPIVDSVVDRISGAQSRKRSPV